MKLYIKNQSKFVLSVLNLKKACCTAQHFIKAKEKKTRIVDDRVTDKEERLNECN